MAGVAGLQLHLASLRRSHPDQLASGPEYEGNVIVHPSAKIGKDCKIGPNVSIGIGCELENGVRIANAVLLHRVKVCMPSMLQQCADQGHSMYRDASCMKSAASNLKALSAAA